MIVVRFRSEHVLAKSAFRFLVVFLARFYDEFRLATALGVLRCYTVLHADAKRKEKVVGERWISTLLRRDEESILRTLQRYFNEERKRERGNRERTGQCTRDGAAGHAN